MQQANTLLTKLQPDILTSAFANGIQYNIIFRKIRVGKSACGKSRTASTTTALRSTSPTSEVRSLEPITRPCCEEDVDRELWDLLDLANDDELEAVHDILYGLSPLSPLIKSLVADNEPAAIASRGRASIMHRIESRFRFLAASSSAVLRGYRPSYRETLQYIRERLGVSCPSGLATADLETEIFLHILREQSEAITGLVDDTPSASMRSTVADGDGMVFVRRRTSRGARILNRLVAPLKLGGAELLPTLVKLGSAVSLSGMRRSALQQLGKNLLVQSARYEAALGALCQGGARGMAATFERRLAVQAASNGLTRAAARYSAVRGALGMLGPLMWACLGADLALKSLGTDYGRLVRAIFALCQIRLLRTRGFVNP
ncbi:g6277 [Coccomyxa elongata]